MASRCEWRPRMQMQKTKRYQRCDTEKIRWFWRAMFMERVWATHVFGWKFSSWAGSSSLVSIDRSPCPFADVCAAHRTSSREAPLANTFPTETQAPTRQQKNTSFDCVAQRAIAGSAIYKEHRLSQDSLSTPRSLPRMHCMDGK